MEVWQSWSIAPHLKCGRRESVSRVRILWPPLIKNNIMEIILVMIYFIAGTVLGYWGVNKLYPHFYNYPLTFLAAIIWGFFCVGFIPLWLCILTFKIL